MFSGTNWTIKDPIFHIFDLMIYILYMYKKMNGYSFKTIIFDLVFRRNMDLEPTLREKEKNSDQIYSLFF